MNQSASAKRKPDFNPHTFLSTIGKGRVSSHSKRRTRSSFKAILGTACSLSKRGRCDSAWCRKTGKKQLLAFWAKAISLEKVDSLVSLYACRLQLH